METSTSNAANGFASGIVALTNQEIELVAGGKAAATTKSFWEKMMDWISGSSTSGAAPTQSASAPPMSPSDFIPLLEACVAAGGTFTLTHSTGGGSASLSLVSAEGTGTTFRVVCE